MGLGGIALEKVLRDAVRARENFKRYYINRMNEVYEFAYSDKNIYKLYVYPLLLRALDNMEMGLSYQLK